MSDTNITQDTDLDEALKKAKDLLGYELFLQVVTLMTHFAFEKKKTAAIDKLKVFMEEFQASLSPDEQADYKERVDEFLKTKGEEFVTKLGEDLSPEEVDELLPKLLDQKAIDQMMSSMGGAGE